MKDEKHIVIGGGLGGLSAALSLLSAGERVTIYEKNPQVGGKAGEKMIGPYRFDTGPSLVTLREVFDRLFRLSGARLDEYIPLTELHPITRYFFADGTRVQSDTREAMVEAVSSAFEVSEQEMRRYAAYTKEIYDLTHRIFLERSLHRADTYLNRHTFHSLLRFNRVDTHRTMDAANRSFFRDERMIQLANRAATYNGSSPYLTAATFNNIFHVEHDLGAYGVTNGIYGIVRGITRRIEELGGEIITEAPVERVLYDRERKITGVQVYGSLHEASQVFSDVDTITLYRDLLKDTESPLYRRYLSLEPSSSAVVFYWGVRGLFHELTLHNILFSSDYRKEFHEIHTLHTLPSDPTIYINITSKITEGDAPEGGENWFVLINAPYSSESTPPEEIAALRKRVLQRIKQELKVDIENRIEAEEVLTPKDIEKETGSYQGSLYGISSNTRLSAFLRHRNRSKRYNGLYHCGGTVHPGGGMPLALLSGMISVDEYLARNKGTSLWESS